MQPNKPISTNKRALHDYEVIDKLTAGLVLKWYEVKSIKSGYVNITNAWVKIDISWKARLEGMDVPLYKKASLKQIGTYDPKAPRLLLLTKREITKLAQATHKTGNTIKVLDIFIWQRKYIKVTIWLVKLMKKVEKKQKLIEKDQMRETDRELKNIKFTS